MGLFIVLFLLAKLLNASFQSNSISNCTSGNDVNPRNKNGNLKKKKKQTYSYDKRVLRKVVVKTKVHKVRNQEIKQSYGIPSIK